MAICEDDVDIDRDRLLVRRFQAGDRDAFDLLYVRYFARLVRFCARRVDHPGDAEELAQEAFARAYRALPRLSGEQRFYPWLSVIAARVCVDHYRSRMRASRLPAFEDRGVEGGQDVVFDEVDRGHVTEAMHRLRPRHQDVLRLREQMEWSYLEIARHYDVSLGAVQVLLFRARHALRREFHAIAGDRGLAAASALGWLLSRGRSWATRVRVAARGAGIPSMEPLSALALVVGATVLVLGAAPGAVTRDAPHVAAPVTATHTDAGATVASDPTEERTTATASRAPALVEVVGVRTPLRETGYREAKDRSKAMGIHAEAGGVVVGADPDAVARDIRAKTDRYLRQVGVRR